MYLHITIILCIYSCLGEGGGAITYCRDCKYCTDIRCSKWCELIVLNWESTNKLYAIKNRYTRTKEYICEIEKVFWDNIGTGICNISIAEKSKKGICLGCVITSKKIKTSSMVIFVIYSVEHGPVFKRFLRELID